MQTNVFATRLVNKFKSKTRINVIMWFSVIHFGIQRDLSLTITLINAILLDRSVKIINKKRKQEFFKISQFQSA